jgi:hypothetical protein
MQKLKLTTLGTQYLGLSIAFYVGAYALYRQPLDSTTGRIGRLFEAMRDAFGSHGPVVMLVIFATVALVMALKNRER